MDPAIDITLRVAVALLFLAAARHKLRDLRRFRATLAEYRLLPDGLVPVTAVVIAGTEVALCGALLAPSLRAPALLSAAGLLLVYGGAIGVNLARGRREIDCGCAGPAVRRPISGWLVARNGAVAAAAMTGLAPLAARPLVWPDALTVAGATAALAALYASVDRLIVHAPILARLRGEA
jgi:hypothetical protein